MAELQHSEEVKNSAGQVGSHPIERLTIVAKHDEEAWFHNLSTRGWEGLLVNDSDIFLNPTDEDKHAGLWISHWIPTERVAGAPFADMLSEMVSDTSPAMYVLKNPLPCSAELLAILNTVTALLQKHEGKQLTRTDPQLFVSANGGYSWNYAMERAPPSYRCFIFMGSDPQEGDDHPELEEQREAKDDVEDTDADVTAATERGFVAIVHPDAVKTFGDTAVLTMTAFYGEGHRKFRMHVGDVVVLRGGSPFLVDLPTSKRKHTLRLLCWKVYSSNDGKRKVLEPVPVYPVPCIEEIVAKNADAKAFYDSKISEISTQHTNTMDSKDIGDCPLYLERLRVTPGVYDSEEVRESITSSDTFHSVTKWLEK